MNAALRFDDIFYMESRGGNVICHALDEAGVLQSWGVGAESFKTLQEAFPWAYCRGDKGFLINFDNVESTPGLITSKNRKTGKKMIELPFEGGCKEVFAAGHEVAFLEDFSPFSNPPGMWPGTAIIFRPVPLAGQAGEKRLLLMTPINADLLPMFQEKQENNPRSTAVLLMKQPGTMMPVPRTLVPA